MDKIYIPLVNGVGIYDKDKLCVAIVDEQGNKRVGGRNINPKSKVWSKPFLRGIGYFWYYIIFLVMSLDLSQEMAVVCSSHCQKVRKINASSLIIGVISCILFSFLIGLSCFGILPREMIEKFVDKRNVILSNFMIALFRVTLLVIILFLIKFIPSFSSLFAFNREASTKGGRENIRQVSPLNFLNLTLNTFLFTIFVVSLIGQRINIFIGFFINLLIFLLILSLTYEILRLCDKTKSAFVKDLCLVSNLLVLSKPGLTQKEVMKVAELEIKNQDFVKEEKGRVSMSCVFAEIQNKLLSKDKYEPSDAEWIVATILGKNRAEIKLIRSVSDKQYRDIMRAVDRRAKGEPLSSIFGFVDFYGLRLEVNKKVLSPRMETEILVELAIKKIKENNYKTALDLCTGSGAIGICLAKFTSVQVTGIDISNQALLVAESNATKNGVKIEFLQSDLFNELKKRKKYDIIVSNPPYIKSQDILSLDEEVKKYDPRLALDGGEDGLDFYKTIIKEAPMHLNKGGILMFELGINQFKDVQTLMKNEGYEEIEIVKDYNKIERIIYGRIR